MNDFFFSTVKICFLSGHLALNLADLNLGQTMCGMASFFQFYGLNCNIPILSFLAAFEVNEWQFQRYGLWNGKSGIKLTSPSTVLAKLKLKTRFEQNSFTRESLTSVLTINF